MERSFAVVQEPVISDERSQLLRPLPQGDIDGEYVLHWRAQFIILRRIGGKSTGRHEHGEPRFVRAKGSSHRERLAAAKTDEVFTPSALRRRPNPTRVALRSR